MPMVEVYEDILDVKANTRVCTINLTGLYNSMKGICRTMLCV